MEQRLLRIHHQRNGRQQQPHCQANLYFLHVPLLSGTSPVPGNHSLFCLYCNIDNFKYLIVINYENECLLGIEINFTLYS